MKILDKNAYKEVCTWIHRNARPLEMALWDFYFENGSKEAVIDALAYYQNEDGGFGNGVEPDCWNPESSPYSTLVALGILERIAFVETVGIGHPMVQGILRFLESGKYSNEDGWLFSIPSNDNYAHAPWWGYDEEQNKIQSMGITAGLCAFILNFGDRGSELYERAFAYTKKILKKASESDEFGEMGAGGVCSLIGTIMQKNLTSSFECESLMDKMAAVVNSTIERDTQRWSMYTPRPSEFIPAPASPFYKGNEAIVEKELDYLIETRNPGGVWNITWTWFDLTEKYSGEFAVSQNWWMASKAIEKLGFLKNFGRVEE